MEHDGDHTSGRYSSQPGQGTEGAGHSRGGLRASSAVTIGWVAVSAAAVVALLIVLQVPLNTAVSMLGLPVFIAVIGWACYLRPRAILQPDGVLIVNVLRSYAVPFARIDSIDHRLGVTVTTDTGRRIGVWALPHSGRRPRREGMARGVVEQHTPIEVEQLDVARRVWLNADDPAPGPGTASGSGRTGGSGGAFGGRAGRDGVVTRFHALPIALIGLTAVWALWGLASASTL